MAPQKVTSTVNEAALEDGIAGEGPARASQTSTATPSIVVSDANSTDPLNHSSIRLHEDDFLPRDPPLWQKRLANAVPAPLKRAWDVTVRWVKGPQPPRIYRVKPIFPRVQHTPIYIVNRIAPRPFQKFLLLVIFLGAWLAIFTTFVYKNSAADDIPGYGQPARLGCSATYWSSGNGCGLNGNDCRPFTNATLAFRCPADCQKTLVLNPRAVGTQEIVYQPLVIGGAPLEQSPVGFNQGDLVSDTVYRGDSFICASAINAGFFPASAGGCGVLSLAGEQASFAGRDTNGIPGVSFDSYFPQSFGFLSGTRAECRDYRWPALIPSVIMTALLSLFVTNPAVHFWALFTMLFWHVGLISDPPGEGAPSAASLASITFGRFLPACFCAAVMYHFAIRRSLTGLTAQFEKTVLWLGPAWVGSLNNYTFDKIPIQRLTPHDLAAQPGAIPALIAIVGVILVVALGQAWFFRQEGRMPRYLGVYGILGGSLIIMLLLPGLSLRLHHYILGLLLLPGTSMQNRPSLVYQGLLLGLFINGVARWGFASILETPAALSKGSAQGTLLPAVTVLAASAVNASITFNLGPLPFTWSSSQDSSSSSSTSSQDSITYDGISVLVNDVERLHLFADDLNDMEASTDHVAYTTSVSTNNFSAPANLTWTWHRHHLGSDLAALMNASSSSGSNSSGNSTNAMFPEYFRFAYMANGEVADYTQAGTWNEDGTWTVMAPGPSLRKRDLDVTVKEEKRVKMVKMV
jgi:hypothetical protein